MTKLTFSGHESFICKQFWLKKVYDFAQSGTKFTDDYAVVELGVGKNMVGSLRYWGKAFGILDESDLVTSIADYLFGDKGKDPYLEDLGTIWLLHYLLVKTERASIYNLVFNEYRKERAEFTKEQLHGFLKRKSEESNSYSERTIRTDINVLLRNYLRPSKDDKFEIEEDFSGLLLGLELVKQYTRQVDGSTTHWYRIEGQDRVDLPFYIVLYAILDRYGNSPSISFKELLIGVDSPGMIFALNAEGLYNKLMQITDKFRNVTYTETAGNQLLQIKSPLKPIQILNKYYGD